MTRHGFENISGGLLGTCSSRNALHRPFTQTGSIELCFASRHLACGFMLCKIVLFRRADRLDFCNRASRKRSHALVGLEYLESSRAGMCVVKGYCLNNSFRFFVFISAPSDSFSCMIELLCCDITVMVFASSRSTLHQGIGLNSSLEEMKLCLNSRN